MAGLLNNLHFELLMLLNSQDANPLVVMAQQLSQCDSSPLSPATSTRAGGAGSCTSSRCTLRPWDTADAKSDIPTSNTVRHSCTAASLPVRGQEPAPAVRGLALALTPALAVRGLAQALTLAVRGLALGENSDSDRPRSDTGHRSDTGPETGPDDHRPSQLRLPGCRSPRLTRLSRYG
jgi:hypothetical protein